MLPAAAFILSLAYWIYLLWNTKMVIGGDAQGYELLGAHIRDGWGPFFATGPQREPLYPLVISWSMHLGKALQAPYTLIQGGVQIFILGLSQFLLYRVLKRLQVRPWFSALAMLYFGFSPAVVNSGFSLYSEILTYPFMLGIILFSARAWEKLDRHSRRQAMIAGVCFGLLFTGITLVKAIFEFIFLMFVLAFIGLSLWGMFKGQKQKAANAVFFLLAAAMTFEIPITAYKFINQSSNGQFTITDRGSWALYGNTARRMQPMDGQRLAAAVAYIPGEGFCRRFRSERQCWEWSSGPSDALGLGANGAVSSAPKSERNHMLTAMTIQEILKNPAQYGLLAGLETMKLFFWESTRVGYVIYPPWLARIYDLELFKNCLRLTIFAVTLAAFLGCLLFWIKGKRPVMLGWTLFSIAAYAMMHAPFFILTRYAFPVVPAFLICIAYFFEQIHRRERPRPRCA